MVDQLVRESGQEHFYGTYLLIFWELDYGLPYIRFTHGFIEKMVLAGQYILGKLADIRDKPMNRTQSCSRGNQRLCGAEQSTKKKRH